MKVTIYQHILFRRDISWISIVLLCSVLTLTITACNKDDDPEPQVLLIGTATALQNNVEWSALTAAALHASDTNRFDLQFQSQGFGANGTYTEFISISGVPRTPGNYPYGADRGPTSPLPRTGYSIFLGGQVLGGNYFPEGIANNTVIVDQINSDTVWGRFLGYYVQDSIVHPELTFADTLNFEDGSFMAPIIR